MAWLIEGKTYKEYLKRGDKFYKFKMGILQVSITEVEFMGFVKGETDKDIPIFLIEGCYESINYFWRDLLLCNEYPTGWYTDKQVCLEAGKNYYIDKLSKSKLED